jgi:hypothetical protein
MDNKDIIKATESTRRLVQDENYYKYIFKKTEKIVSVVFYIANNVERSFKGQSQIDDVLNAAKLVHDAILATLEVRVHVAEEVIRNGAHTLIALESKLRVSQTLGIIAPEVMHVLTSEIDAVLRGMNKYLRQSNAFDDLDYGLGTITEEKPIKQRRSKPALSEGATPSSEVSSTYDRRERIKTVLEAKGEATIKDISEIITDCSEKTIQRELNAMIADNVVKRQGERRWSKYSLF